MVKSTSIDPAVLDGQGFYRHTGPAKIFTTERAAVAALKAQRIKAGDVMVLLSCGPLGTGMEEIAQVTTALKYLDFGNRVAVLTDARFSGFSTGACVGHIGPEALGGGPLGKLRDGDRGGRRGVRSGARGRGAAAAVPAPGPGSRSGAA